MKRNKLHLFLLFLILASAIKLVLGAPYHHEDADQFFYWGKYLWEKKDFLFFTKSIELLRLIN